MGEHGKAEHNKAMMKAATLWRIHFEGEKLLEENARFLVKYSLKFVCRKKV